MRCLLSGCTRSKAAISIPAESSRWFAMLPNVLDASTSAPADRGLCSLEAKRCAFCALSNCAVTADIGGARLPAAGYNRIAQQAIRKECTRSKVSELERLA